MTMLSSLRHLFKSPFDHSAAHALYVTIVQCARLPVFYDRLEVQDTPEGRFDLLALHTYLVLRRLSQEHERTAELGQALFDLMFADLDQNLREMGYGDTGVAKRIRKMAEGFYGRMKAYDEGLAEPVGPSGTGTSSVLEAALDRNLFRDTRASAPAVSAMARYVRQQDAYLAGQGIDALIDGQVRFSAPVAPDGA